MATDARKTSFGLLLAACALNLGLVYFLVGREFRFVQGAVTGTALLAMLEAWVAGRVLERRAGRFPAFAAVLAALWLVALGTFTLLGRPAVDLGLAVWVAAGLAALAGIVPALLVAEAARASTAA